MAEIASSPNRVSLNNNIVDGRALTGGYTAWQLYPTGLKVAPVRTKSDIPYTASNAAVLYMFGSDGDFDQFYPQSGDNFNVGEEIQLRGPTKQPGTNYSYIEMIGLTSTLVIRWGIV